MDYFFYNTDKEWKTERPPRQFHVLIDKDFAACGGDRKKYGEQLDQLDKDDVLLMYENGVGVVAVGRVEKSWDGECHTTSMYYSDAEMKQLTGGAYEYRIKVKWFLDLSDNPITLNVLRERFDSPRFPVRGVIKKNVKYRPEIERMIEELQSSLMPTPEASDMPAPAPDRVKTTTYRILRDTVKAIDVKNRHEYKCQICNHTIELPDGKHYAEAHHIRPLGKPHDGPDVIGNILCVCPNHHAELDYGVSPIELSALHCSQGHAVDPQYVAYHNQEIYNSKERKTEE